MNKVRWGVLGYARIAREQVIPAIVRAGNSEFHAIASRQEQNLAACVNNFSCPKAYASYDELLADPEVQAVYIPLPNALHLEWTLKAARHGKHILCEKPLALNATECRAMIEECAAHRVKLMEAFMYRYTDRTRKVQGILASGVLGEIKYINSCYRFLLTRDPDVRLEADLGGGSLYDVGCYPVNFLGVVTGCAPTSIKAEAVLSNGVDLLFSAILKYPHGIVANLNSGFNAFGRVFSEIIGTKGILEIPDTFLGSAGSILLTTADGRREIPVSESDRYLLEIEDFAGAILTDHQPLVSPEESCRNMEIIDRLRESIRQDQAATVSEPRIPSPGTPSVP